MYKRNSGAFINFFKKCFFFASFHPSFSRHIKKEGKQKNIKNHLIAVQIIIKVSQETIHWIEHFKTNTAKLLDKRLGLFHWLLPSSSENGRSLRMQSGGSCSQNSVMMRWRIGAGLHIAIAPIAHSAGIMVARKVIGSKCHRISWLATSSWWRRGSYARIWIQSGMPPKWWSCSWKLSQTG